MVDTFTVYKLYLFPFSQKPAIFAGFCIWLDSFLDKAPDSRPTRKPAEGLPSPPEGSDMRELHRRFYSAALPWLDELIDFFPKVIDRPVEYSRERG